MLRKGEKHDFKQCEGYLSGNILVSVLAEATKQEIPHAKGGLQECHEGLAKSGVEENRDQGGGLEGLLTLKGGGVRGQSSLRQPLFPGRHQGVSLQILPCGPPDSDLLQAWPTVWLGARASHM